MVVQLSTGVWLYLIVCFTILYHILSRTPNLLSEALSGQNQGDQRLVDIPTQYW